MDLKVFLNLDQLFIGNPIYQNRQEHNNSKLHYNETYMEIQEELKIQLIDMIIKKIH